MTIESVIEQMEKVGVQHICICPGGRNQPFIPSLKKKPLFQLTYGFEERSTAFFALGRSRILQQPVAVITTSGTAAAELLPAAMEGYYSGVPLLLITADRPRRFRGTGAPQTANQVGIFGEYVHFSQDVEGEEKCALKSWSKSGPAHINICLEDPSK